MARKNGREDKNVWSSVYNGDCTSTVNYSIEFICNNMYMLVHNIDDEDTIYIHEIYTREENKYYPSIN